MTLQLRDYQEEARDHLWRHDRAALFLDMGLGKTATVLCALTPEHLPALVVATKRVAEYVWPEEVALWRPDLRIALAIGAPAEREKALNSGADIVVISRDNLAQAARHRDKFRTFIIDESSGFKGHGSARFKAAKAICLPIGNRNRPRHVWEMTGSPSPNGLLDLWAPTYLLDEGARLGPNITTYRSRYFVPGRIINGHVVSYDLKPEADKRIHEKLDDICLAMESEGRVDVPRPVFNLIEVPLSPKVRELYRTFKRDLLVGLGVLGEEVIHTASGAAQLTGRLSQLTGGFMYEDDPLELRQGHWTHVHQEKLRALQEVVEGTGSPVLVAYRFRAEAEMIKGAFEPGVVHTMDEPDIVPRWNRGEIPVLLAHPASAGHGLNLQYGGHTAVWYNLTWNLEEWVQFNARLARPGQTKQVVIHVLTSPDTVDELVYARLGDKKDTQDALLAHLESPL